MKKTLFLAAAVFSCGPLVQAGEITAGAAPGTINYQGRLERDNAPLTGIVHLTFRVYGALTGGNDPVNDDANCECHPACADVLPASPKTCLWSSGELPPITASQGIFNANMTLPWQVLSGAGQRYLEVQVEGDILTPREPISSVAYAMVAKKLEDGANLRVSTLTLVDGDIIISTVAGGPSRGIIFPDNSRMISAGVGMSTGGVTAPADLLIQAGTDNPGKTIFSSNQGQTVVILDNGNMGIGAALPASKLEVAGDIRLSGALFDSAGGNVSVGGDLAVTGGRVTGANSEYIEIGKYDNRITFFSGSAERMRVHNNGFVGIGLAAPTTSLQAAGIIYSTAGVRGSSVTIGAFNSSQLGNEIRTQGGVPLILQNNITGGNYNVGIGTSAPSEKLHVKGSVLAEKGVIASTAAFSGNVTVGGDFTADSGQGSRVVLSSTTIYGSLTVVNGAINVQGTGGSAPAYTDGANTFTKHNVFQNWVLVSSDIVTPNRLGAGVVAFDFPGDNYLQVGDGGLPGIDATAYLVGGDSANALLKFYRGASEAARFETQSGANLGLVIGNQTKTLTDSVYHRIQNSVVWISTGYNTTPAVFVSSSLGNVGMGTSVMDPNWRLTVQGNIRISDPASQDYGIIFSDGSTMKKAGLVSVDSLANKADALVEADTDINGTGSVILKSGGIPGLTVKSGGNIAIGGAFVPKSLVHIRGGDLMVGGAAEMPEPYKSNGVDDIYTAGSLIFDGGVKQRSATPVEFYNMYVANDVFLSTTTGKRTRIGSDTAPGYTLDVTGDINASTNIGTGGTVRISNTGTIGSGNANATWDGNTIAVNRGGTGLTAGTPGGLPYYSGAAAMTSMAAGTAGQALLSGGAGAPGWGTLSASYGGTGQTGGYAVGDILYASAAGTLSRLADIATGSALLSGGVTTAPSYGKIGLTTHVSGVLPVANGGTNSSTALSGTSIMISNGTNIVQGDAGTTTTLLHGNASGAPSYSQASLTADVSGILPLANGGANADLSGGTFTQGSIIYKGAAALAPSGQLTGVLRGNGSSAPTAMTGTAGTLVKWGTGGNNIVDSLLSDDGTDINANSHKIINVSYPGADTDASNRKYVDDATGSGTTSRGWSKTGNNLSGGEVLGSTNAKDLVLISNNTTRVTITSAGVLQLSSPLGATYGGTNSSTALSGNTIMVSNGSAIVQGAAGTTTTLLHGNASGAPTYSQVSLTADVTGIMGSANGGTGNGFTKFTGPTTTERAFILPDAGATILTNAALVTVAQGGTGLSAGTAGGLPYYSGASAMTSMGAGSSGQALLSGAAGAPSWGTLSASYGGTGQSGGYTVGDLLYASAAGTLTKLADVGTGNALISGGANTAPSYGKIGLTTHISGTLAVGNGGTGLTAGTPGGLPYYSGAAAMTSMAAGSSGEALLSGAGGAPSWGTLSASYGGTGQSGGYTVGDILYASAAGTLTKLADVGTGNALISGGANTAPSYGKIGLTTHVSGTLAVGNGGTGAITLNGFVRGSGTGVLTASDIADIDVPDTISINGTNNVTWASVDKTGSSLADLPTRSADLLTGTLGLGHGGTGANDAAGARGTLGAAQSGVNSDITSFTNLGSLTVGGPVGLYSRTKSDLIGTTPGASGQLYFCSDCSPAKVVVSTGTAAGNFAAVDGGAFQ